VNNVNAALLKLIEIAKARTALVAMLADERSGDNLDRALAESLRLETLAEHVVDYIRWARRARTIDEQCSRADKILEAAALDRLAMDIEHFTDHNSVTEDSL
jgi:uncharacterized protein with PIN domain